MEAECVAAKRMASRIRELMGHSTRYAFDGRSRLVKDTGVSRSEMTRLLSGDCNPSYRAATLVVEALERDLGLRIDPREVLSFSGKFARTVCEIVGCRGCPACRPAALGGGVPPRAGLTVRLAMPEDIAGNTEGGA